MNNQFPSQEVVARVRETYPSGCRVGASYMRFKRKCYGRIYTDSKENIKKIRELIRNGRIRI